MSTTLYRKYRPSRWEEIAGQQHVKVTLAFEVATGKTTHAYLFAGPRGVGKTTVARILAKAINCTADERGGGKGGEPCGECANCVAVAEGRTLDIIEIDAASHRGIDSVRENIIENARFAPSKLKSKVFIIDEVHMLTTEAFNALLKTLEEPPAHAVFILATTELHKVPQTIVSRCQRFDFRKIPYSDLTDRLHSVAEREGCKVDRKVLEEIARHADGCLRDAEGLLGKVLTVGDGKRVSYDEALVVLPRSDFESVAGFVEAILKRDSRTAVITIGDVMESGMDIDQFAGDAVELLRKILLVKMSGDPDVFTFDLDDARKKRLASWAELADIATIVRATELLLEKRKELKTAHPAQLPLELAAIRLCEGVTEAARPAARPTQGEGTGSGKATKQESVKLGGSLPGEARADAPGKSVAAEQPQPRKEAVSETRQLPMTGQPAVAVSAITERWASFVERAAASHHSFNYLLCDASVAEVTGHLVRIGVAHGFHREKMNNDKNRKLIEEALSEVMGVTLRVEGVLLEKKEQMVHIDAAKAEGKDGGSGGTHELAAAFGGTVD